MATILSNLGHIGIQCLAALTATTIIVVDRNPEALKLAEQLGAHHTVVADGTQRDVVLDLTAGRGAEVVLDFVAEQGAEQDGFAMTGRAGSYFVIGYGGTVQIPTLDISSPRRPVQRGPDGQGTTFRCRSSTPATGRRRRVGRRGEVDARAQGA